MSLEQTTMTFPDADKGYLCPCCGQLCKRYYRKLNCNMAMTMVALVRKKKFGFVPVEEFLRVNGYPRSGDFPYLVHYGMLEKMEGKRADGSKKNGFYKLTDKGRSPLLSNWAFTTILHLLQTMFFMYSFILSVHHVVVANLLKASGNLSH